MYSPIDTIRNYSRENIEWTMNKQRHYKITSSLVKCEPVVTVFEKKSELHFISELEFIKDLAK